jgi:hypothetical protein
MHEVSVTKDPKTWRQARGKVGESACEQLGYFGAFRHAGRRILLVGLSSASTSLVGELVVISRLSIPRTCRECWETLDILAIDQHQ